MVRNPAGEAFVALADEESTDGPPRPRRPFLVDDEAAAGDVRFTADVDGTDAARAFVAASAGAVPATTETVVSTLSSASR